jgi:hypothetical protein
MARLSRNTIANNLPSGHSVDLDLEISFRDVYPCRIDAVLQTLLDTTMTMTVKVKADFFNLLHLHSTLSNKLGLWLQKGLAWQPRLVCSESYSHIINVQICP